MSKCYGNWDYPKRRVIIEGRGVARQVVQSLRANFFEAVLVLQHAIIRRVGAKCFRANTIEKVVCLPPFRSILGHRVNFVQCRHVLAVRDEEADHFAYR